MNCVGGLAQEGFDRGHAFRDPGAVIEHPGNFIERGKVDFPDRAAQGLKALQRVPKRGCLYQVTEKFDAVRIGDPDGQVRRNLAQRRGWDRPREGVCRVAMRRDLKGIIAIRHREREDRNGVQRTAGWDHAAGRLRPKRGFQADDVVQRGRDAS